MPPRFLAAIDPASGTARLDADETRHLSQVLRLAAGDEVVVFDGGGREYLGRVEQIAREGAVIRILAEHQPAPEPSVRVTLAQAALKGDKMDDVVRDATMMGVAAIEPLVTEHTAAHLQPGRAPERWRRIAIASAKQCRRAVVPTIGAGLPFGDWVARDPSSLKILLTEPSAEKPGQSPFPKNEKPGQSPFSATVMVGPEGGWSEREVEAATAAGYVTLTLGRRTLRADAVATIAIGVLLHEWGDL